jgi:hypothetical protein
MNASDKIDRRRPHRADARRIAAARHQNDLGRSGGDGRQGGLACARFLAALGEQEIVERNRRRFERNREEARLPPGTTLDAFPFSEWGKIFPDPTMTLAAIDRPVHHASSPTLL